MSRNRNSNIFNHFDSDSDSDGEDNHSAKMVSTPCNCQDLACYHKVVCAEAYELAEEYCMRRHWRWSWYDEGLLPCICCMPAMALGEYNGETFWECNSGNSWLMVNHPAVEAKARVEDITWGDLIMAQEKVWYNHLTERERKEYDAAESSKARAMEQWLVSHKDVEEEKAKIREETIASLRRMEAEELAEREAALAAALEASAKAKAEKEANLSNFLSRAATSVNTTSSSSTTTTTTTTTAPVIKYQPGKRYDRYTKLPMPCRQHNHDGILGNVSPAVNTVNKAGKAVSYPAGCQTHDDFVAGRCSQDCPFFHIGDPEWQIIINASKATPTTSSSSSNNNNTTSSSSSNNNTTSSSSSNNKGFSKFGKRR